MIGVICNYCSFFYSECCNIMSAVNFPLNYVSQLPQDVLGNYQLNQVTWRCFSFRFGLGCLVSFEDVLKKTNNWSVSFYQYFVKSLINNDKKAKSQFTMFWFFCYCLTYFQALSCTQIERSLLSNTCNIKKCSL